MRKRYFPSNRKMKHNLNGIVEGIILLKTAAIHYYIALRLKWKHRITKHALSLPATKDKGLNDGGETCNIQSLKLRTLKLLFIVRC